MDRHRVATQGLALAALLVAVLLAGARLRALTTETYADTRTLFGVPNFLNVASNLAFLLAGIAGLALCASARRPGKALASWRVFYAGMLLTSLGSAWYHLAPSDARIVWDRLGMTVAFVGLAFAVLGESTWVAIRPAILATAIVAGAASVLWWRYTGDLAPYAWVQLAPLACTATALAMRWIDQPLRRALEASLGLYVLAKLAETFDGGLYMASAHVVSGHTLKHLLAAAAAAAILAAQTVRVPAAAGR